FELFTRGYRFLRSIEARLRLMNTTSRNDLPDDRLELAKLARAMDYADEAQLLAAVRDVTRQNRERFEHYFRIG
ncbi:MAG: hypothetical protein WD403_13940, partial [Pirellulales bacterium]